MTSSLAGIESSEAKQSSDDTKAASEAPSIRHRKVQRNITPAPLALCIVGIVLGASIGVYGRTHEWLGANPQMLANKWRITGLTDKEISRRLFDQLYPPVLSDDKKANKPDKPESEDKPEKTETSDSADASKSHQGVLFSGIPAGECTEFKSVSGSDLRRLMSASGNPHVREFAQQCKNDATLKLAVEDLICQDTTP